MHAGEFLAHFEGKNTFNTRSGFIIRLSVAGLYDQYKAMVLLDSLVMAYFRSSQTMITSEHIKIPYALCSYTM